MGKIKVPKNVDLDNATIGGVLKQIRKSNGFTDLNHVPAMVSVWVCNISPKDTKRMLEFIEKQIKRVDASDFTHAKRFMKVTMNNEVILRVLLCSVGVLKSKDEVLELLRMHLDADFNGDNVNKHKIPDEKPMTKDQALSWSSMYWPLSWKGNPNHQDLITANIDLDDEQKVIAELLSDARKAPQLPIVTYIMEKLDSGKLRLLYHGQDIRHTYPLKHSIMNAIEHCAEREREKRKEGVSLENLGYLCHNLLVYTTHEPCTMCAMALVHSRIGKLTYIWPNTNGAIELSHFIGDRRDLNWTFDIWRWVGPEANVEILIPETEEP